MNNANKAIIEHMIVTTEIFIEYAKADTALFADETIESFKVSVRCLRQILEAQNA
jgi:hypothetical protein